MLIFFQELEGYKIDVGSLSFCLKYLKFYRYQMIYQVIILFFIKYVMENYLFLREIQILSVDIFRFYFEKKDVEVV